MNTMLRTLLLIAVLATALMWTPPAVACPNCKDAVAANDTDDLSGSSDGPVGSVGAAYSYSVIFMLVMPILLLSSFGAAFYCLAYNARKVHQAESSTALHHYDYSTSPSV